MTVFDNVKVAVTPRQAAERYGYRVGGNSMMRCPFHDDRSPSLKLYDDHYHCFGCQATGDVIDFTAKIFGISPSAAAQKLAQDFGVEGNRVSILEQLRTLQPRTGNKKFCEKVLQDYLKILKEWKVRYAPISPGEEPHERYAEASTMIVCVEYMIDQLMLGTKEMSQAIVDDLMADGKAETIREWIKMIGEEEHVS